MKRFVTIMLIAILCISNTYAEEKSPVYSIYINAASRILKLFSNEILIKEYPIAVGKTASKTPVGSFTIRNKAVNPVWHNKGNPVAPGPRNPLGIRWMGISAPSGTYGIHGNNTPSSIGTFASGGCIRMYNNDVEELYSKVNISAKVQISYDSIEIRQDKYSNSTALIVYPDAYKQKNAEALIKKMAMNNPGITKAHAAKAIKLAARNISNPVVICDGTAVLLNNQYVTNDAFFENEELYVYHEAAVDNFGMDGEVMAAQAIPVLERNHKVYINLTQTVAQIGGQLKIDASNNNAYISTGIVKVNGKYLCSYKGGFDKEYLLEADVLNQIGEVGKDSSKQMVNLKTLCKQLNWQFNANSLFKMIEISTPLKLKVGSTYISTEFYMDRYYIDSEDAVHIPDIQNQQLTIYPYKDKSYYAVDEIMNIYNCQKDKFFTTIEVMELQNSEV